jgi:hypothetical protein
MLIFRQVLKICFVGGSASRGGIAMPLVQKYSQIIVEQEMK